jgi:hypothetical protein
LYELVRPTLKRLSTFLLSFICLTTLAQSPASSQRVQPSDGIDHITLGQSVFPLNGPYKFSIGDSPIDPATHQPLWAQPGFDDSHWETVDLTPPQASFDPTSGISGYVPGWTAKGHPGYSGYAWYRIRVKVEGLAVRKLALAGPNDVDDAFQVFANGTLLGSFGDFSTSHPTVYESLPTLFPIPPTSDGTQVFAFRIWMEPSTLTYTPDAGGFHTAPLLGHAGAVSASYQVRWLELVRAFPIGFVESLLFFLLAVLAISLSIFDRSDKVYYWIAVVYAISACSTVVEQVGDLSQSISTVTSELLLDVLFLPLILAVWVMVWRVWFQLRRPAWLPKTLIFLTLTYMVANLLGEEVIFGLVSHSVAVRFHLLSVAVRLLFLALLMLVVVLGVRQQGREGWVALPAVLMLGIARSSLNWVSFISSTSGFPSGCGSALALWRICCWSSPSSFSCSAVSSSRSASNVSALLTSGRQLRSSRSSFPSPTSPSPVLPSKLSTAPPAKSAVTSFSSSPTPPTAASSSSPATSQAKVSRPACLWRSLSAPHAAPPN